jgi:hypothetical protein
MPAFGHGQYEKQTNGGKLDNGIESIFVIHTIPFVEPFRHKTSFITLNRAIRVTLGFEYPFRVNEIKTRTWGTSHHVSFFIRA